MAMIIFLLFVFIPPLRAVTLDPILSLQTPIFGGLNGWFSSIFGFRVWE
jgi:hypothetical protein